MRGDERVQDGMFIYVSLQQRVPVDHPLRADRRIIGPHPPPPPLDKIARIMHLQLFAVIVVNANGLEIKYKILFGLSAAS
jgi:hypothetical protein